MFASGSGTNAQKIAEFLKNNQNVKIDCILSNKKDAFVLERAKKLDIDTFVFNRNDFYDKKTVVNYLIEREIDFIVLAGFLWLIPSSLLDVFPNRIINIHPALLPKYGGKGMYGMHVHRAVVEAKEKTTGITIHYVNENYDEGNIIFQASCPVNEDDTPEKVAEKVHKLEHEHFPRIVQQLAESIDMV
jgi:phosphoribosylglycinamide formyltransferase-1